jgi:ATP-dependent Lon protease
VANETRNLEEIPSSNENRTDRPLPVLPVRDTVLFPHAVLPLTVGRESSVQLINSLGEDKTIVVIAQREARVDSPQPVDLYPIGTLATVHKVVKMPNQSLFVFAEGLERVSVVEYTQLAPYMKATVATVSEVVPELNAEIEALQRNILTLFQQIVAGSPTLSDELSTVAMNIEEPGRLVDFVASSLPSLSTRDKQDVLETYDVRSRLDKINQHLAKELEVQQLRNKIQSEVQDRVQQTQREYYLREQLKAIQKELGEQDDSARDVEDFKEKIEQSGMPEEVKKEAMKELNRLSRMSPMAADYSVTRNYLEWLVVLPWTKSSGVQVDITKAKVILDEDHYDLQKVKDRILDYLSVRHLNPKMKGPILCFFGPPGVGKTSLGKSIARALGRKFVRMSLGGIHDEAEIRGHRRTYIGAMPGQIIQGIRRAEANDPVYMMDEIDKVGRDYRGDPTAALLEALDPEQNSSFRDNYLDVTFDLSKVLFITTANQLDTIPDPLRDRMEIIDLHGYTEEDKQHITDQYLIRRQTEENGLTAEQIEFTPDSVSFLIRHYTREAGVRSLERQIGTICRKQARRIVEGNMEKLVVTREVVQEMLGGIKVRVDTEIAARTKHPGVVVGLAWTPTGGDILFIEALKMKGKGEFRITGQIQEVMRESMQAAFSWVKAHAEELKIDDEVFTKYDLHIHVPAGAIPKDGPSAGVTIVTALVSLLTNKQVRPMMAMTGEITLSGNVLPIGGVKEKFLAAKRAGVTDVLFPAENKQNVEEDVLPEQMEGVQVHYVASIEEVLDIALPQSPAEVRKDAEAREQVLADAQN